MGCLVVFGTSCGRGGENKFVESLFGGFVAEKLLWGASNGRSGVGCKMKYDKYKSFAKSTQFSSVVNFATVFNAQSFPGLMP